MHPQPGPAPADLLRVVIVGGVFGGLYAACALASAPVNIPLIDSRNHHFCRPMLYQVATGLLSGDEIAKPPRSILSRHRNVEVLLDEVVGVDADARLLHLAQYHRSYDFLILATGIQYNYFGHQEWQQIAPGLTSLEDADEIRGKVLPAPVTRRLTSSSSCSRSCWLAVERLEWKWGALWRGVAHGAGTRFPPHRSPRGAQILLYEAESCVLPTYPEAPCRDSACLCARRDASEGRDD